MTFYKRWVGGKYSHWFGKKKYTCGKESLWVGPIILKLLKNNLNKKKLDVEELEKKSLRRRAWKEFQIKMYFKVCGKI
jgi:hypothetical protein